MTSLSSLFLDRPRSPASRTVKAVTATILAVAFSLLCWLVLTSAARRWEVFWQYREAFWSGWLLTIAISCVSLLLTILIGVAAALGKRSPILFLRYLANTYVELVRGMPLLVLILFFFYGIPLISQLGNRFVFGVLALSFFSGAYLAEMIRAGIDAVGKSQWESARAIGLTTTQTYRYVVFPQALRHTLPALTGQLASLIKDSSLLSVIALNEFTFAAQNTFSATYASLESFLPLGVGYLILTLPISLWTKKLERSLRYDT